MRRKIEFIFLLMVLAGFWGPARIGAQSGPQQKAQPDQLGMTCAQILQMSSSDWIAKVTAADASAADANLRGISSYGRCYDARTDRLAASLGKTGKGPLMGARGDFRDFEGAVNDFTAKALAPNDDPVKTAYAWLYEKQFRYAFYQSYESKSTNAPGAVKKPVVSAAASTPPAPPAQKPAASASTSAKPAEPKDVDPMTLAKNHFGEILRVMPDDRLHEIHAAFGAILGQHQESPETQLAVYRYAIFVLEAPSATPFAPPPF